MHRCFDCVLSPLRTPLNMTMGWMVSFRGPEGPLFHPRGYRGWRRGRFAPCLMSPLDGACVNFHVYPALTRLLRNSDFFKNGYNILSSANRHNTISDFVFEFRNSL